MTATVATRSSAEVAVPAERVDVSLVRAMTRGMERADQLGLAEALAVAIVGGHVQVSLELADALQWWPHVLGVTYTGSFVQHWPEHGYAQISGELDCPWVITPVQVQCNDIDGWCKRCADLGSAPVRVTGDGQILPRDHTPEVRETAARHRAALDALYRDAQAALHHDTADTQPLAARRAR